jgi:hypothetical protein
MNRLPHVWLKTSVRRAVHLLSFKIKAANTVKRYELSVLEALERCRDASAAVDHLGR